MDITYSVVSFKEPQQKEIAILNSITSQMILKRKNEEEQIKKYNVKKELIYSFDFD